MMYVQRKDALVVTAQETASSKIESKSCYFPCTKMKPTEKKKEKNLPRVCLSYPI